LFQYAFARIIAERHGFALDCEDDNNNFFASSHYISQLFPNALLQLNGARHKAPVESWQLGCNGWNGNMIDIEHLGRQEARAIQLYGYFQRYEYYDEYRESLHRWFWCGKQPTPYAIHQNDVLINIRRGVDFGSLGWILPLTYYSDALSTLANVGTIYVSGVDIDQEVRMSLKRFDPVYLRSSSIAEQFGFIMRFSRIILANSTFSWWAAFLSDATEIYAPRCVNGAFYAFRGFQDVDLHMRDNRYREIDVLKSLRMMVSIRCQSGSVQRWIDDGTIAARWPYIDSMRCNTALCGALQWLLEQRQPVTVSELHDRFVGDQGQRLIRDLIRLQDITLTPHYVSS
jgi:hypothetical protein